MSNVFMSKKQLLKLRKKVSKIKSGKSIYNSMKKDNVKITPLYAYINKIGINVDNVVDDNHSKDFGKALALTTELCGYCQINDKDTKEMIGGIIPEYCKKYLFDELFQGYPNVNNKGCWIAHSIKNPEKRLGFLFGEYGTCKNDADLIVLGMVCANSDVKPNPSFRYLMGLFLLNAKFMYDTDVVLEVADVNLSWQDQYGSTNVESNKYKAYKANIDGCKRKGIRQNIKDSLSMYAGGEFDVMSDLFDQFASRPPPSFSRPKPQFFERITACPPKTNVVLFAKRAEQAERLVCNYNRWGFYDYGADGQTEFRCFSPIPYEILYNDVSQYDPKIFVKRLYELIKRKRRRLKVNRDMGERCLDEKYGDISSNNDDIDVLYE